MWPQSKVPSIFFEYLRRAPVHGVYPQPWRPQLKTCSSLRKDATQNHIRLAIQGDQASRTWIAAEYSHTAYRVASRFVDQDEAKDLAHDAMIKVFTRLDQYDPRWTFQTWVSTITRNTCIDWIRRRKRLSGFEIPEVACTAPRADEVVAKSELKKAVRAALEELPPMYRQVLELHHFQDLKYREIADTLDVPIGTVMNRIHRARKKMALSIGQTAA